MKNKQIQYKPTYSLLGDVGGTNMRFQVVLIQPPLNQPLQIVKKGKLAVKDHDNFCQAIRFFLSDIQKQKYPQVAVIAVAGPVQDNSVILSNVMKWGQLNGEKIQKQLNIHQVILLNDFISNSYGLLLYDQSNFISLNGLEINKKHIRGVLGPGTGLGNTIIYNAPFRKRQRIYILPSQAGHTDTPYINQQTQKYLTFLGKKIGHKYVGLQYSFCGPAIPYMFQYLALKYPQMQDSDLKPTSQQIMKKYSENSQKQTLYKKTVQFFLQLYCSTICNFMLYHMAIGGIYLVGSLTSAVVQRLKQINITQNFEKRHPQMSSVIKKIPIVFSKQVDLGLKGAYVYARRIISDQQHD